MTPPARAKGFTLVELLVTLTILGVLLGLAAPSMQAAVLGHRLSAYANGFVAAAQLARSEAIKRGVPVTLCPTANRTSCATSGTWAQGWMVACPQDGGTPGMCGTVGTTLLVIHATEAVAGDYRFTGSSNALVFQPSGVGATAATLTLCRATPSPGAQERVLTVTATGRVGVRTERTGTCT